MTRRLLILAYDFPPRGTTSVIRITKYVRYLTEFGWRPVVIAAAVRSGFRDDALLAQLPPDLEVIRVANPFAPGSAPSGVHSSAPSFKARTRQQLRRLMVPDAQMLWVPGAVQAATRRLARGDIDALMTTAPPYSVHIAGLLVKQHNSQVPWLMDLRDIWSENPAITNLVNYKLQRACELLCLRHADHVTTATDGQRLLLERNLGLSAERASTITNGFDSADLPQSSNATARPNQALRITYLGSIIGTRASATQGLFAALERLSSSGVTALDVQVRLIGIFDPVIYSWAQPFEANGMVQVVPFMPQSQAYAEMVASDVLLLIASDDREGRLSHPNKLFEYFAVGRPVLAIAPEGDISRLVCESNVGTSVLPSDVDGIEGALQRLIHEHKLGGELVLPTNAKQFARFERRELARQLANRLDQLVS